jgi:REP element-mobilizing transposase RayT
MKYRKNIRLREYDYSNDGYYFVTICCSYVAAERKLCERYKLIIEKHLKNLEKYEGVKLDYYQIMPNHIHFILILEKAKLSLCRYIQIFKSQSTLEIKSNGFHGKRFWQPNYYEHIIRDEDALTKIREYIHNNPLAEKVNWEEIYGNKYVTAKRKLC